MLHLSGEVVTRIAVGIVASGGATAIAVYQPVVLLGAAGVVLVLIAGVVLPAVWSRRKERRAAAARVLHELLTATRPAIPNPAGSPQRPATPAPPDTAPNGSVA
jgi:hypothetical protein